MSANITRITLDGKRKTLTRARAQRFVDSGSDEWQGPRTIREIRHAKAVPTHYSCIINVPIFDYEYPYQGDGTLKPPDYHIPPYNYPLPFELLRMYERDLAGLE